MKRRGWFFVWLLPLLWMVTSVLSFQWPGDEYGLWSFGSLAGLWIVYLIGNIGNTARIAIFVIIAGSVSMVPLGLLLDMLRVRRRLWLLLYLLFAAGICVTALASFPSLSKAISKNGSITAYVLFSLNMGMYAAIIVMVLISAVGRLVKRGQPPGGN